MSPSPLARVAAPIAVVAGALVVVTRIVIMLTTPADLATLRVYVLGSTHAINSVASIVAFALLALALVAIYERVAGAAGGLGVIGLAAALVGTMFMTGDWWYEAFAVPWLADVAPVVFETGAGGRLLLGGIASFVLFGLGWVLFVAAGLRARVLPAGISGAILAGGLLSGVPIGVVYLVGNVVLGLAIAWLGVWLMRTTGSAT